MGTVGIDGPFSFKGGALMSTTVVLGLSGGVDSAVAARLLQENYTVIGLYLSIGPEAAGEADARRVAEELGIEFHTMDISRALEEHVKAPFAAEYLSGHPPALRPVQPPGKVPRHAGVGP